MHRESHTPVTASQAARPSHTGPADASLLRIPSRAACLRKSALHSSLLHPQLAPHRWARSCTLSRHSDHAARQPVRSGISARQDAREVVLTRHCMSNEIRSNSLKTIKVATRHPPRVTQLGGAKHRQFTPPTTPLRLPSAESTLPLPSGAERLPLTVLFPRVFHFNHDTGRLPRLRPDYGKPAMLGTHPTLWRRGCTVWRACYSCLCWQAPSPVSSRTPLPPRRRALPLLPLFCSRPRRRL